LKEKQKFLVAKQEAMKAKRADQERAFRLLEQMLAIENRKVVV
jgi:hypothetical protein